MNTINISLPDQLKGQADALISQGFYASFSDLVRTALRRVISENQYDVLTREAIQEHRIGRTKALKTKKDIKDYVDRIMA